jgi:hypothetical protein
MIAWTFFELEIHKLQRLMILILKKPITRKLVSVQTVNAKCGFFGTAIAQEYNGSEPSENLA